MVLWLYGWESRTLGHYAANFGGYRHCHSGDKMLLNCHVISEDYAFKGLFVVMGGSPS